VTTDPFDPFGIKDRDGCSDIVVVNPARPEEALVLVALAGLVVLAIVGMRVVGRRAERTVAQVNELLGRNEALFQAMVRDSNDIMAVVDAHGLLKYASPVTERILGLDVEPLVGTSVFDLIHPEDRHAAFEAFHDVIELGHEADRLECRLHHADGGWRAVEVLGTNLFDDPNVAGMVLSARDLTDRRRAEADLREAQERFRSAFEHAPIGMALVSLDGRLFRVNRALVGILGRSEPDLLRADLAGLSHPDDADAARRSIGGLLASEVPSDQHEQRFVHRDGHPVWMSVRTSLVRDVDGRPLYFVSQMEDITGPSTTRSPACPTASCSSSAWAAS